MFQRAVFLCVCLLSVVAQAETDVRVVASIKPLQLVVQGVVGELGKVDVLVPAGSSPHHYSLKPSALRTLSDADLVVWNGPQMELFLTKVVANNAKAELRLIAAKEEHNDHAEAHHYDHGDEHHDHDKHHEGHADNHHADDHDKQHGHHDEPAEEEHAGHGHDHNHGVGEDDPHIWLDPELMRTAAVKIHAELAEIYPAHAAELSANLKAFLAELAETDQQLQQQLAPLHDKGFVVFHDAFGRFVGHYDLKQVEVFTVDPARAPGAKTLNRIEELLRSKQAMCVFTEPEYQAAVLKKLVAKYQVKTAELDPLAVSVKDGEGYTDYLKDLAASFTACLGD